MVRALTVYSREHKNHNAMCNEITSGGCKKYARELAGEIEGRTARVYSQLLENARAAGTVDLGLDPALFAFFLDNLFMMLQFSYSCDYYAERMKIFCGADIADDTEKMTECFMRFAKNALRIEREKLI